MDCLPAAPERAGNEESWAVADAISTVLKNSEELHSWRRHLFSACIKGLVAMYSSSKDEGKQEVERSMLLRLEELLCVVEEVDPDDWCDLVKTGLNHPEVKRRRWHERPDKRTGEIIELLPSLPEASVFKQPEPRGFSTRGVRWRAPGPAHAVGCCTHLCRQALSSHCRNPSGLGGCTTANRSGAKTI
ncbi:nucleolar pre-ribosomal-associated protein 1 isoform X1 [Taeniopygia guttata]|uniref:nucleolar pre-ribosomal-associated protein 1 isoform X1 n=2 Tax=Taeniopygia guttata TaxID=59729 RepID=UPI003BB8E14B